MPNTYSLLCYTREATGREEANNEDIAYSMHCTESNVFKVHSKALQAVKLPKLGSEFQ